MKHKIIILAVLFLGGAAFFFLNATRSSNIAKESEAPGFEVRDAVTGNVLSSSDLKNKIIFVHFWASW